MSRPVVLLLGALASFACARTTPSASKPGERLPAILKISTRDSVSLEVLDWGGSGPPIVFLAGGGNSTPHDFDDFAPLFTNRHRVIGITRRGSGGSSAERPRSFDGFVDDIVAVLDAFHFERAIIVGHSFAGLEMARFGERDGRRCAALVYLDAAYDYTDPALDKIFEANRPPSAPPMLAADSASIDAVRDWLTRTQRFRPPVAALRASRLWDNNGRLIGQRQSPVDSWNIPEPHAAMGTCRMSLVGSLCDANTVRPISPVLVSTRFYAAGTRRGILRGICSVDEKEPRRLQALPTESGGRVLEPQSLFLHGETS